MSQIGARIKLARPLAARSGGYPGARSGDDLTVTARPEEA